MGKQHYLTEKVSRQTMRLLTFVLILMGTISARAAAKLVDFGNLELNKSYTYTQFADHQGKFTAPRDGSLVVTTTCGDFIRACKDEAHKNEYEVNPEYNSNGHLYYELAVKKDEVIYFFREFVMTKGGFLLKMVDEKDGVRLENTKPEANSIFSMGGEPEVNFYFSGNVMIDGAEIAAGSTVKSVRALLNGANVTIQPKQALYDLHKEGALKKGDSFTVRLKNVRFANNEKVKYGTDGTCELTLISAGKATGMVKAEGLLAGKKLLSFYPAGDERGFIKATFDAPLQVPADSSTTQVVTLTYGSVEGEEGEFYVERIPYQVKGNVLTCDLTGKLRTAANMVKSGTIYSTIGIKISNVRDTEGNLAFSTNVGALGSFSYSLAFEEVKTNINTQFTPANGGSLKNQKNIELWIQGYDDIRFAGVEFTWGAEGKDTLITKDFTLTDDPSVKGAKIMTIPVPAAIKGQKNVKVTLHNLVTMDGLNHTAELTAKYDAFVVQKVTYQATAESVPVNLEDEKLKELKAGGYFVVKTNMNDSIGYAYYMIRDLNPQNPDEAIIYPQATLIRDSVTQNFQAEIYGLDYKLFKNHTYAFEVTAFRSEEDYNYHNTPIGKGEVTFEGTTEPYRMSDIQLKGITPEAGTTIEEAKNLKFTLTFDGMVKLDKETTFINTGMGSSLPFDKIEGTAPDAEGYTNEWNLYINQATLQGLGDILTLSVVATDYNGRRVKGNVGKNETTYFLFEYPLAFNAVEVTIEPANMSEVDSLYQFIVSCPIGINEAFNGTTVVLYDRINHKQVAKVKSVDLVIPDSLKDDFNYIPTSVVLTLDSIVKEPGSYILDIPEGFFALGTEFNGSSSKAMAVSYVVKENSGEVGELKFTTDPANGSTVESLSSILVTFPNEMEIAPSYMEGIKMTISKDGAEATELPDADLGEAFNSIIINLAAPVTGKGIYTINIPEGYLLDSSYSPMKGFSLVYGVGTTTGIANPTLLPTDALKSIYTLNGVRVNKQLHELPAGIYIVGGKKVIIK
ncbi:hypothetical protein EVA_10597 [gut metagenome]|uniref:Uncharacterized protein n=1 Tax=gut metagenome TaxID=749906 RepID=J9GN44_9ZZZZ